MRKGADEINISHYDTNIDGSSMHEQLTVGKMENGKERVIVRKRGLGKRAGVLNEGVDREEYRKRRRSEKGTMWNSSVPVSTIKMATR